MALGFHFGGAGGGMPSNPVLFGDGAYMDGVSEISCRYNSSTTGQPTGNHQIVDGIICNYSQNGGASDGVYLTFDLSNYEGKYLNYEYRLNNAGNWISKSFAITSSSKRPIFGAGCVYESGWNNHVAFGISNEDMPAEIRTNSNVYDTGLGALPSSPALAIRKIWISN